MTLDVGKIGFGLMGFTWSPNRKFTQEQFNKVLKHAIDLNKESPLFINAGEFYGNPDRHENLRLLGGFFETYPSYADKVIVSVKGGINSEYGPNNSAEELDKVFDAINHYLSPLFKARQKMSKTLDYYTIARQGDRPLEEILEYVAAHRMKGEFKKLCLSEIDGPTLKKASEILPVDMIEVEFSLFCRQFSTNGSFEVASELGIPVAAYSPLGMGLLVGLSTKDLPEGDLRHRYDQFHPENYDHNAKLINAITQLAKAKDITPSQVAINWILKQSGRVVNGVKFPQLIPIPGTTNEGRVTENFTVVDLSDKDLEEINTILDSHEVKGDRYFRKQRD